jgi:S13-like H2TH domain
MANPPMLTPEQRQRALEKAGAARRQRAEVKDKLKMGALSLGELFEATDRGDESGNMLAKLKVVSVLESLPGVGKVNAKRLLKGLDISDGRRLGGVGDKQRERLLRVVDDMDYRRDILAEARRSEESAAR